MKTIILTEKPSVARDIARVLGLKNTTNGAIDGKDYTITWALGHLVTLAMPEELKKEWIPWTKETLPMIPERFETRVISKTQHQFNNVKALLKKDIYDLLVIATDAGREGELVARWIIEKCGWKKPIKRLWINSMTDKAILDGFKNLKDGKAYVPLYLSALARAKADWLVGLNASRALTVKHNAQLSAGRVQTPTLSLIVEREHEIRNFKPVPYATFHLNYKGLDFVCYESNDIKKEMDLNEAEQIIQKMKKEQFAIVSITKKIKKEVCPELYSLTTLQQDANKIYGFGAKYTLDIVQKLYEEEHLLTYPRTDSSYLPTDLIKEIPSIMQYAVPPSLTNVASSILKEPINTSKRIFNNDLVTDHHALIPTGERYLAHTLSADEEKIYQLVLNRFLGIFMKDYTYESNTVSISSKSYTFKANYTKPIHLGYKQLSKEEVVKQKVDISEHELVPSSLIKMNKQLTSPKDRYTEATLLYAMEHADKYTVNSLEKAALNNSKGIGTPATRAEIIERLFSAAYIKLQGKSLVPTIKGEQLIDLVPSPLKTVSLTALQEMKLEQIAKSKLQINEFMNEMIDFSKNLTSEILDSNAKYAHDNQTTSKCPTCGKNLLLVDTKFGRNYVCQDKNCGFKKNVYRITKLRCPNCHKILKQYGEKEKAFFQCECGFKEKTETFFKQIKENKQGISARDARRIMKKDEENIPKNNPFADFFH